MTPEPGFSFVDYIRPVWRFKWLVLLVVIIAAGATYSLYVHKPTRYEASTQLYVGGSSLSTLLGNQNAAFLAPSVFAEDASLLTTTPVASRVISDLKLNTTPAALLGALSVSSDATSDALALTVTAAQPQQAVNIVNGFARAYLEVSTGATETTEQNAIKSIKSQLAGPLSTGQRNGLNRELLELQGLAALPPEVGEQVAPALTAGAIAPDPKRDAIFAGAIALLLSIIACYVFDRSDKRVRRVDDIERILRLPVQASIPRVRRISPSNGAGSGTMVALREPYRTLRVNLDVVRSKEGARTIMVTSAVPAEGKTTVVHNLALAYREAGLSVAIIEGDMRRPALATLFGIPTPERGLSDILESHEDARSVLVTVAGAGTAERIDLLPAGRPPENPTALLHPDAFLAVRNQLLADHALVLVDSPPVLAVSDALAMASHVDGLLIVVRAAVSTVAALKRLRHTFDGMPDVKLLGAVANAADDELGVYGYNYYRPSPYEPLETSASPQ